MQQIVPPNVSAFFIYSYFLGVDRLCGFTGTIFTIILFFIVADEAERGVFN